MRKLVIVFFSFLFFAPAILGDDAHHLTVINSGGGALQVFNAPGAASSTPSYSQVEIDAAGLGGAWRVLSGAGESFSSSVMDCLKAYIYQHEKTIDGEIATAAYVASEEHNGLAQFPRLAPEIQNVVLEALKRDLAEHRTEYQARIHIANGESLGPGREWNLRQVQEHLWFRFVEDRRWLRRIFQKINQGKTDRGLKWPDLALPPHEPLQTDRDSIRRICEKLGSRRAPEGPACAANPIFALREAKEEDPVLVAAIFRLGFRSGLSPDPALVAELLEKEGWILQDPKELQAKRSKP